MVYNTFSIHAPTGANDNAKIIVSPNEYAAEGRNIGFPSRLSVYVNKQPTTDGSFSVSEQHAVSDVIGSRVYLYHRPLVGVTGGIVSLNVQGGGGTVSSVNPKQGYVDFSVAPTSAFTVVYTATPDCFSMWNLNTLQDDMMETQRLLGPSNQTGWVGLRNLTYALFNKPDDALSGLTSNSICLPHLGRNVKIGSSDDTTITGQLGDRHTIQVGYYLDNVIIDATGVSIKQSAAGYPLRLSLSNKTGDFISYEGQITGSGPITIGGPSWPGYSGSMGAITQAWYTGSMLRVNGNATVLGGLQVNGSITLVHTTGQTSTVMGDWTVRDELFVYGVSHLIGPTETNDLTTHRTLYIDGDIVANNLAGAGGGNPGQSLVDRLDPSEIAHTYTTAIKRILPNSVIEAPRDINQVQPVRLTYSNNYILSGKQMAGEQFILTGFMNAQVSSSGQYRSILQVRFNSGQVPSVSGYGTGTYDGKADGGIWSKGMFDPGSLWIEMINGSAAGYKAPIYSYNVQEQTGISSQACLTRVNLYTPVAPSQVVNPNDLVAIYHPGSVPYRYIFTNNGDPATFFVSGSTTTPLKIAFDDHVRIQTAVSPTYSMKTALQYSVSGLSATTRTGVVYIFANSNGIDVELAPIYTARPTPFRMPGETIIGEIVASSPSPFESFTVVEATSYRPGGFFDTSWIPTMTGNTTSGRSIANIDGTNTKHVYFKHDLGADLDFSKTAIDLYLGDYGAANSRSLYPNDLIFPAHSMYGADARHGIGISGAFTRIPLHSMSTSATPGTHREASIFYMDGKVIGVELNANLLTTTISGATPPKYMRLVMKRLY